MSGPADAIELRNWLIGILVSRLGGEVMVTAEEIADFEGTEMMMWQDTPSLAYRIKATPKPTVINGEVVRDQHAIGA